MGNKIPFVNGLIVRVKVLKANPSFWDSAGTMMASMGQIKTIKCECKSAKHPDGPCFHMVEDDGTNKGKGWFWRDIDLQKVNTPM
jgi:hypothetical protein